MTMDQAAVWLAGSILTTLGFMVIVAGIIVINNLLHKHWHPVTIFNRESFSLFGFNHPGNGLKVTDEEYEKLVQHLDEIRNPAKVEPELDKNGKPQ